MWLLDARVRGNQRFTNNAVGPGDHEEEMGSRIGVRRIIGIIGDRPRLSIINQKFFLLKKRKR
jgi:hypothetical protein